MIRFILKELGLVAIAAGILIFLPWAKPSPYAFAELFVQMGFVICFLNGAFAAIWKIAKLPSDKYTLQDREIQVLFALSAVFLVAFMAFEPSLWYAFLLPKGLAGA